MFAGVGFPLAWFVDDRSIYKNIQLRSVGLENDGRWHKLWGISEPTKKMIMGPVTGSYIGKWTIAGMDPVLSNGVTGPNPNPPSFGNTVATGNSLTMVSNTDNVLSISTTTSGFTTQTIRVNVGKGKTFALTGKHRPYNQAQFVILAYDNVGNQLWTNSPAAPAMYGTAGSPLSTSTLFGGTYVVGCVSNFQYNPENYFFQTFTVDNNVDHFRIGPSGVFMGFDLYAIDCSSTVESNNCSGLYISENTPASITNVTYPAGMVANKAVPAVGQPAMWFYTGSTWLPTANL